MPWFLVSFSFQCWSLISFKQNEVKIESSDGYIHLNTPEKGRTVDEGMPELPIYTSFFQMDAGISYTVSYTVISSHTVEDVEIYPYQGESVSSLERSFIKNRSFKNTLNNMRDLCNMLITNIEKNKTIK